MLLFVLLYTKLPISYIILHIMARTRSGAAPRRQNKRRRTTRASDDGSHQQGKAGRPSGVTEGLRRKWLHRIMSLCDIENDCTSPAEVTKCKGSNLWKWEIQFRDGTTISRREEHFDDEFSGWVNEVMEYVVDKYSDTEIESFVLMLLRNNHGFFEEDSSSFGELPSMSRKDRVFYDKKRKELVLFAIKASGSMATKKAYIVSEKHNDKSVWGFNIVTNVYKNIDIMRERGIEMDFWSAFYQKFSELIGVTSMEEEDDDVGSEEEETHNLTMDEEEEEEEEESDVGVSQEEEKHVVQYEGSVKKPALKQADFHLTYRDAYTQGLYSKCVFMLDEMMGNLPKDAVANANQHDSDQWNDLAYSFLPNEEVREAFHGEMDGYRRFEDVIDIHYRNKVTYDPEMKAVVTKEPVLVSKGEVVAVTKITWLLSSSAIENEDGWVTALPDEKKPCPQLDGAQDAVCVVYKGRMYGIVGYMNKIKQSRKTQKVGEIGRVDDSVRMEVVLDSKCRPYVLFVANKDLYQGDVLRIDWTTLRADVPKDKMYYFVDEEGNQRGIAFFKV